MSDFSNFANYGYQISHELGHNQEAGRITYLATDLNTGLQVVIKEFRFAIEGADWSAFKAYEREIEVLQHLDHPRIPRYINCFETSVGFCLVQEYKNSPSLAERRIYYPEQIKQIAVSLLEILVDLQKRIPPVIHRDIKPENILVDNQQNAYLVDFGLARVQSGKAALSSVAAGTPGFMPPEEQFGRSLTEASDLYSLGATLICLVTGTRSVDVGNLIDDNYRFDFKKLVPQLSPRFVEWLTKMVEPNLKNRHPNAAVALEALQPIEVMASTNWLERLISAINIRKSATVFGVVAITSVALLGTISVIFNSQKAVKVQNSNWILEIPRYRAPRNTTSCSIVGTDTVLLVQTGSSVSGHYGWKWNGKRGMATISGTIESRRVEMNLIPPSIGGFTIVFIGYENQDGQFSGTTMGQGRCEGVIGSFKLTKAKQRLEKLRGKP